MRAIARASAVRLIALVLCAGGYAVAVRAAPPEDSPPENGQEAAGRLLRQRGLTPVGTHWLTKEELRLRRQLTRLDELQRRERQLRQALDELLEQNEAIGRRLERSGQQRSRLDVQRKQARGDAARKKLAAADAQLAALIDALRQQYVPPNKLGCGGASKRLAVELIRTGTAASLAFSAVRELLNTTGKSYEPLRQDRAAAAAIESLPGNQRLGSGRNYVAELKKHAAFERRLDNDAPRFYREGKHIRLTLLVNGGTPATFTFHESSGPLLIPASLVQSAGIKVPADAPRATYTAGDRRLAVRVVHVSHLRLGPHTLVNTRALVLPPEGEYLGPQIGRDTLAGYQVEFDDKSLRVLVQPN